jgi:hypothetical protein
MLVPRAGVAELGWSGPPLTSGARTVNDPSGVNAAQVILFGGGRLPGAKQG